MAGPWQGVATISTHTSSKQHEATNGTSALASSPRSSPRAGPGRPQDRGRTTKGRTLLRTHLPHDLLLPLLELLALQVQGLEALVRLQRLQGLRLREGLPRAQGPGQHGAGRGGALQVAGDARVEPRRAVGLVVDVVDLALGGGRLLPAVRERAQVVRRWRRGFRRGGCKSKGALGVPRNREAKTAILKR